MALWNAALNQNLLHEATAPIAREIEKRVIAWMVPFFGMSGGHMTSGSTLANLTALWAARELAGIEEVIASESAHVSVAKSAQLLALRHRVVPSDGCGAIRADLLPKDLARAALVLTAGTTATGAIDPLELAGRAAWTHVDAAWAGALRLSSHGDLLQGIERADSVALSAHKWLFQPKDSALVLFRDAERAHSAVTFTGAYLATPNVGLLGSRGAAAVPLLATLLAWGRQGLAAHIERCLAAAHRLAQALDGDGRFEVLMPPKTGIVLWRPRQRADVENFLMKLPPGTASMTLFQGERWLRCVAANPNIAIEQLLEAIFALVAPSGSDVLPGAYRS
jgi:L-2,4-diaminobutyrate decarboxylase